MSLAHPRFKSLCIWLSIALGSLSAVQLSASVLPSSPAQAQEAALTTEAEVTNYANTVSAIEPLRLAAYEAASDVLVDANSEISLEDTPMSCLSSDIADMPEADKAVKVSLQDVLVEYCNQAIDVAEANGLTPERFNSITTAHRADGELAKRIQTAMRGSGTVVESETVE